MIDNVEYTIHRPILTSIINDLKNSIFKNKDIYTEYLNNYEDSDFDSTNNIYDNNSKNEYLEISSEITSNEDRALENTVLRRNHKALLIDSSISFSVAPNTINTRFAITLKYYNKSKNSIVKLINKLKLSIINNSYYDQHEVKYYYTLPVNLLILIKNINTLKNGVNTNYYPYLNTIATNSIDYVNSRTKDYSVPTIRENQPVIGNFETDFFNVNKIDKEDRGWYIELEYIVDIEIPTNLLVFYPMLINNKVIDTMFIPKGDTLTFIRGSSNVIDALSTITGSHFTDSIKNNLAILNYPIYDNFTPTVRVKPGMYRLISLLTKLNPINMFLLLNITSIENILVNKSVTDYIKTRVGNSLFNSYEDLFHFELYENEMITDKKLYIDNNFNIKSVKPLDINKTYRLILHCLYDLNMLTHRDRLQNDILTEYMDILSSISVDGRYDNNPSRYTVLITNIFTVKK